ncbi:UNVERIFIED_CONTAM: hypothetical protein Sradi_3660100 [Sesamum radiatum]|uniref:Uncharacterized protein n=1 Tax=Sesamum radiatum TaxID=300843 RepID=A0AAW2QIL2_SESRA
MLIDADTASWKLDLVYQLFEEEEAQLMLNIHTYTGSGVDKFKVACGDEGSDSVHLWMRNTYTKLDGGLGDRFLVLCWSLWRSKCMKVMKNDNQSPLKAATQALLVYMDYIEGWKQLRVIPPNLEAVQ